MNKDIANARRDAKIILSSYKDPLDILDYTGRFECVHLYLKEIEFRFNNRGVHILEAYKYASKNSSKCLGITLIYCFVD